MTGDRGLAEDVLQNTFVYFFERLRRYEPRGLLAAYLFRIARSFASDEKLAARRVRAAPEEAVKGPAVEDREAAAALEEKARQALLALPGHLREVVELRLYQGFDYARVAEITGTSEATARSRMRYALEALRAALGVGLRE
jgi:RNA polymerase sigma-70 factor (ECF subfamily)